MSADIVEDIKGCARTCRKHGRDDDADEFERAAATIERLTAELAASPAPTVSEEDWHLGSMNDGLFIINCPPRPSTDDVYHERTDGPTLVLNVTDLPVKKAQAIVDAHNTAIRAYLAASPAPTVSEAVAVKDISEGDRVVAIDYGTVQTIYEDGNAEVLWDASGCLGDIDLDRLRPASPTRAEVLEEAEAHIKDVRAHADQLILSASDGLDSYTDFRASRGLETALVKLGEIIRSLAGAKP